MSNDDRPVRWGVLATGKIARKFAVKADAIEAENPGLDPTKIKVGSKIRIPKK
jgi:LysM repeat protein